MDTRVADVLRRKGNRVYTIGSEATVVAAAREMNDRRIGSLIVVDGGRPVGIITERDILTRIVAAERSPASSRVAEVMTSHVLTCEPESSLDELRTTMAERRIRHVPVLDGDRLIGMISIGDLNSSQARSLDETIGQLRTYIGSV